MRDEVRGIYLGGFLSKIQHMRWVVVQSVYSLSCILTGGRMYEYEYLTIVAFSPF